MLTFHQNGFLLDVCGVNRLRFLCQNSKSQCLYLLFYAVVNRTSLYVSIAFEKNVCSNIRHALWTFLEKVKTIFTYASYIFIVCMLNIRWFPNSITTCVCVKEEIFFEYDSLRCLYVHFIAHVHWNYFLLETNLPYPFPLWFFWTFLFSAKNLFVLHECDPSHWNEFWLYSYLFTFRLDKTNKCSRMKNYTKKKQIKSSWSLTYIRFHMKIYILAMYTAVDRYPQNDFKLKRNRFHLNASVEMRPLSMYVHYLTLITFCSDND